MNLITTNDALIEACDALKNNEFIAIDTEFMRETTYWPVSYTHLDVYKRQVLGQIKPASHKMIFLARTFQAQIYLIQLALHVPN